MLHFRRAQAEDFEPLQQLLELYQYELSDLWPQSLDAAGRYGYDLTRHRAAERSFAYLALDPEAGPAGFALVAPAVVTRTDGCWMEQFFILKSHRRTGAGRALAQYVFSRHPGPWEVGQMPANLPAQAFWRRVIAEFTGGAFVERQVTEGWWQGVVQQFPAPPAVQIVPVAEGLAASYRACLDVVARERRYLAQTEALPLERIQAFVRDSVTADAVQFMAVQGEQVVGWADVFPAWAPALAHCGTLGMGVLPAFRGQGLGRRLLEACIAKAWAKGLTRIQLEVRADNERAIGLYRALGFEVEAVKRRALRFDGVDFDALSMALLKDEDRDA